MSFTLSQVRLDKRTKPSFQSCSPLHLGCRAQCIKGSYCLDQPASQPAMGNLRRDNEPKELQCVCVFCFGFILYWWSHITGNKPRTMHPSIKECVQVRLCFLCLILESEQHLISNMSHEPMLWLDKTLDGLAKVCVSEFIVQLGHFDNLILWHSKHILSHCEGSQKCIFHPRFLVIKMRGHMGILRGYQPLIKSERKCTLTYTPPYWLFLV